MIIIDNNSKYQGKKYIAVYGFSYSHKRVLLKIELYNTNSNTFYSSDNSTTILEKDKESPFIKQDLKSIKGTENIDYLDLTKLRKSIIEKGYSSLEMNSIETLNVEKELIKELISIKTLEDFNLFKDSITEDKLKSLDRLAKETIFNTSSISKILEQL